MLQSSSMKYLFIHVPKTGGTSLVSVLKKDSDRVPLFLRSIGYLFDDSGIKLPRWTFPITGYPYHVEAATIKKMWGDEEYNSRFKFAFVRNPWDLIVSEYFYIKKKVTHHLHRKVNRMSSFEDYVLWKSIYDSKPQSTWLCDENGNLIIDFIGRFENYEIDANFILEKLKYTKTIPHKNATIKRKYTEYYTAQRVVDAVGAIYADDIRRFQYEFEK